MKKMMLFFLALILLSCGTYSDEQIKSFNTEIQRYISKNQLEFESSSSGLYYKIFEEGEGEFIKLNDYVSLEYEGKLLDGTEFDNTKDEPIELKVSDLIQGWKEMMVSLKPGSEVEMIIPPHLGYGTNDLEKIPPNSILFFHVKVLDVK